MCNIIVNDLKAQTLLLCSERTTTPRGRPDCKHTAVRNHRRHPDAGALQVADRRLQDRGWYLPRPESKGVLAVIVLVVVIRRVRGSGEKCCSRRTIVNVKIFRCGLSEAFWPDICNFTALSAFLILNVSNFTQLHWTALKRCYPSRPCVCVCVRLSQNVRHYH